MYKERRSNFTHFYGHSIQRKPSLKLLVDSSRTNHFNWKKKNKNQNQIQLRSNYAELASN